MLEKIISLFCLIKLSNNQVFAQTINPSITPNLTPELSPSIIASPSPSPTFTLTPSPTVTLQATPTPTVKTEDPPMIIIYSASACPSEDEEFIQIQNLSQQTANINNWQIGDLTTSKDKISNLTLINAEISKINLKNVKLNNNGDEIFLYDQNNQLIDHVVYSTCTADQLILFHQPTPTPSPLPSPTATLTITPTANPSLITPTPLPMLSLTPQLTQTPIIETKNYPTPKIFKSKQSSINQPQKSDFLVKNILYQEMNISPLQIANVIMTGIVLIWMGLFLNYEKNQF